MDMPSHPRIFVASYILSEILTVSVMAASMILALWFIQTDHLPYEGWWYVATVSNILMGGAISIATYDLLQGSFPRVYWIALIAILGALVLAYGTYRYWPV